MIRVCEYYIDCLLTCPPRAPISSDEEDAIFSFLDDPHEFVWELRKRSEAKLRLSQDQGRLRQGDGYPAAVP